MTLKGSFVSFQSKMRPMESIHDSRKEYRRKMSMSRIQVTFLTCLLTLLGAYKLHGQVLYGSLTGNVTDPSGAAVPKAHVVAVNQATNVSREADSDEHGVYRFTDLQPGLYRVTVTAPSFQTFTENNVQVPAGEVRRVDVKFQLATTSQTVEVNAESVVLQTDKGDIHTEISNTEVEKLPYNGSEGKNFQSLLLLQPGAVTTGGNPPGSGEANSAAGNPQRAITIYQNGVSSQANNTRIDGALNAYPWLPVNIAYVPSPEAIQTVNVSTNAYDAEQGMAGGAAVNVQIKSGTNQLHGSFFERNTNNDFSAVNGPFTRPGRLAKNIQNQFGFTLGGPVWIPKVVHGKDKLFWFMSYESTRQSQFAAAPNLTLPTAAMRSGDFSQQGVIVYDPLTGNPDGTGRTPFPGNVIPSNRINPASATLTAQLPALTRPTSYFNNYDAYGHTTYIVDRYDWKVNYNPTDKAMMWGRYSISPMDIVAPLVLGPIAGGDAFNGGNPGHAGGRVQVAAAGLTYSASPTLVFDGNVGFTRQNIGANGDEYNGDYGTDVLHIPGTNGSGAVYQGVPGFQVTGIANMGNTNTGSPFKFRDNQYTTNINVSKIHGAHNIRAGFEYDHAQLNHFQPQGGTFGTARGTFGFDGSLTALKGGPAINQVPPGSTLPGSPANSWAQFLLGYPSHVGKITQVFNPVALRFSDWG